ncbi:hypothetical protein HK405_011662, partial [Cladochytrium tenue]
MNASVQAILSSCHGNVSALPSSSSYFFTRLLFQHVLIPAARTVAVVGAPVNDFVGNLEAADSALHERLAVQAGYMFPSAAGCLLLAVALSVPATWVLVRRPLRRLPLLMDETTEFDFSSLYKPVRHLRSWNNELRSVE